MATIRPARFIHFSGVRPSTHATAQLGNTPTSHSITATPARDLHKRASIPETTPVMRFWGVQPSTHATAQLGNTPTSQSIVATPAHDLHKRASIPETTSTATLPPIRIPEGRPFVPVDQGGRREHGPDHFRRISGSEVSPHVLPPRLRSFDAFRHFVKDRHPMKDLAPPSTSSSDGPELLRELESLGHAASEVLSRMHS